MKNGKAMLVLAAAAVFAAQAIKAPVPKGPLIEMPPEGSRLFQHQVEKENEKLRPKVAKVTIFPVPTTSRCVVIMVCQFMIIYTALALVRTYQDFSGKSLAKGALEAGLKSATQTLTFGPMICVLFIACRMRVEFLSNGQDQPQVWVQHCMYATTFSVLASTLLVLFLPMVTGKPLPVKEGTCDLEMPICDNSPDRRTENMMVFAALTGARYLIMIGLYIGLAGVIVGINIYLPPGAKDLDSLPPPAPAVMCTMILAVVFFSIQLVIAFCRSYAEFTGQEFPKTLGVMNAAATTVEFAPMLAILFLAARMRALQHDGQPQKWAQDCMFASTYAMCATTVLSIMVPLVLGGSQKLNPITKEATFDVPDPTWGYVLVALRYTCMVGFYGGAVGVACSIFTFVAPAGPDATMPVSPTVQCVLNLTCQFFFVYFMMTVMLTVSEISGGVIAMEKYRLFGAIEAAKSTLSFAPMLSILFVTTRMYALQLTDKKGAPQPWVQDGMFMATWSLMISFLMCLATGLLVEKVETDDDGNIANKFSNEYIAMAVTFVRYLTMLLLYGGITTVIVGLFMMTPETASGHGKSTLSAPPGPNTVVGAKL